MDFPFNKILGKSDCKRGQDPVSLRRERQSEKLTNILEQILSSAGVSAGGSHAIMGKKLKRLNEKSELLQKYIRNSSSQAGLAGRALQETEL